MNQETVEEIRRLYPTHSARQLGERFGLTICAIHSLAKRCGFTKQPRLVWTPDSLARLVEMYREGRNDREIADELGCNRHTVGQKREQLGLPTIVMSETTRRLQEEARQRHFARIGVTTLGQVRARSYRQFAKENGWPEDLRPRAVQVLNLLASRPGFMTRKEIADAIGMRPIRVKKILTSNDAEGSYLAHLTARGLILRVPKAQSVAGCGRGKSVDLYTLGPAALAILQQRQEEAIRAKHVETDRGPAADPAG